MYLKFTKRVNKYDENMYYFYVCEADKEDSVRKTKVKYLCSIKEDEFLQLEKFAVRMNGEEFELLKKRIYLIQKKAGANNE